MDSGRQNVPDAQAREEYRAAATFAVLVFLSGTISLAVVPWEPFWLPNIAQAAVCAVLLAYLVATWRRPIRRAARAISALLIVYTLLLVPWLIVSWCRLGRPLDAFAVPKVALVSVALVYRGPVWFGAVAIGLFAAENLLVYVCAHWFGLDELLPLDGPTGTVGVLALGVAMFVVCQRRRQLSRKYVQARAELVALARVRPQFAHARDELEAQISTVATELGESGAARVSAAHPIVRRALARLSALQALLDDVISGDDVVPPRADGERRLWAHETQLGATLLATIGVAMNAMAFLTLHAGGYDVPWPIVAKLVFDGAVLLYLVATRRRPSPQRALWAVVACTVTALATATYADAWLIHLRRPHTLFFGHKALMGILALALGTRFGLGAALILATGAAAIVLWFVLGLGDQAGLVPVAEPWVTLIYTGTMLVALRMVEQSWLAALALRRAEAEASGMQRRARLFVALRDRLNSPLQTLVLCTDGDLLHLPARGAERVRGAVGRLVALSRELAALDVAVPPGATMIDADRELRQYSSVPVAISRPER